jgi:hypothetical protein
MKKANTKKHPYPASPYMQLLNTTLLLQAGADPNLGSNLINEDARFDFLLYSAVEYEQLALVELFLQYKANPNIHSQRELMLRC